MEIFKTNFLKKIYKKKLLWGLKKINSWDFQSLDFIKSSILASWLYCQTNNTFDGFLQCEMFFAILIPTSSLGLGCT